MPNNSVIFLIFLLTVLAVYFFCMKIRYIFWRLMKNWIFIFMPIIWGGICFILYKIHLILPDIQIQILKLFALGHFAVTFIALSPHDDEKF